MNNHCGAFPIVLQYLNISQSLTTYELFLIFIVNLKLILYHNGEFHSLLYNHSRLIFPYKYNISKYHLLLFLLF